MTGEGFTGCGGAFPSPVYVAQVYVAQVYVGPGVRRLGLRRPEVVGLGGETRRRVSSDRRRHRSCWGDLPVRDPGVDGSWEDVGGG